MTSIAIASGKGGVGKSSIAINLGIVLAKAGKSVVVVDADVGMSNLALMLGVDRIPITLNNVLQGENDILDAVYDGPAGMKYVPAQLSVDTVEQMKFTELSKAVQKLEKTADYVLIDCPPGWGADAKAALSSARQGIIVLTPEPPALADAIKTRMFMEKKNVEVLGAVLNMVLNDPAEVKKQEIESPELLGLPVLVSLPEDIEVRRASAMQVPVAIKAAYTPFMKGITFLAEKITKERITVHDAKPRKGLLQSIIEFIANIFPKKS